MLAVLTPILVILVLVILNGLFVAAEFALIASRRSRLLALAEGGSGAARALVAVFDQPTGKDFYIAIAQLGITLASVGLGMYGEPQIAGWLYGPFERAGLSYAAAHTAGFVIALSLITFMHVVFGEMIPKALALQTPEAVSVGVNPLMRVFGLLFRPLITVLNFLALGLMRLLRVRDPGKNALLYTSKELSILTDESAGSGQLNAVQRGLIHNIFALEERTAEQLMTSRARLEALSAEATPDEVMARIAESARSRYPVFEEHLDQIIGVLHVKDFIRARVSGRPTQLRRLVRPLQSVAASTVAEELLALFKRGHVHAALVVDEFGGTLGFVTMDDLIEDVMLEETDWAADVQIHADGSLSLDGEVSLADLRSRHGIDFQHGTDFKNGFDFKTGEVITIAGLLLAAHGTLPGSGATVQVQGYELSAEEVQGLKITRVGVRAVRP